MTKHTLFSKQKTLSRTKIILIPLLLLAFVTPILIYALVISRQALLFPQNFSPPELQEDLSVLHHTLEEADPSFYRYTSQADMDKRFAELQQKLDLPMDEDRFFQLLAPLIASIKDGHMMLHPATALSNMIIPEKVFPFSVRVVNGKLFVLDDFATPNKTLRGVEIVSINKVSSATILATMLSGTTGDGNITTGKQNMIGRGGGAGFFRALFSQELRPLLGIFSPYTVVYRSASQEIEQTLTVEGKLFKDVVNDYEAKYPEDARPPLLPNGQVKPENQPYFLDHGALAVWKFSGFGGYTQQDRQGASIDTGFQAIEEQGSTALILDVRNNTGGLDALGARLFSYFADAPFYYYDDLVADRLSFDDLSYAAQAAPIPNDQFAKGADGKYHWVKHPNWGVLQPRQPHFAGKVYVIINGGCFSTCAEFISILHFHKKALFIGEEVGGAYYGNTSGYFVDIYLPHTKLYLTLPIVRYNLSVSGYADPTHGVMPEYPVKTTIEDLLAGNDTEMNIALSIARSK